MTKELRKIWDPSTAKTWLVNVRTGVVRDTDGEFADDAQTQRMLAKVRARMRAGVARSFRDRAMRDMGLHRNRDGSWE